MTELRSVLQQYPGFRLYCTGHSLGGALAILLAFELAASSDPSIPKPVTCISIASPKVGNLPFRRAFQVCINVVVVLSAVTMKK
jgi:predicted lipase